MRGITPRIAIWLEYGAWLAIAAFFYGYSFGFAGERGTYLWGAASWPRTVVMILMLTATVQLLLRYRQVALGGGVTAPARDAAQMDRGQGLRAAGMMAIPLAYVALLPYVGFYAATPVFLIGYLAYLGERRWGRLIGVPLFIYALINLVFTKIFFVALPVGNWPGFYDFSNWLLVAIR